MWCYLVQYKLLLVTLNLLTERFTDKETLVKMIEDYMDYYNNKRLQRGLGVLPPMEKHELYLQAV